MDIVFEASRDASVADARAWVAALFASIDAKDAEGFLGFLSDDATFQFANFPPASGAPAIRDAVVAFFASVAALKHEPRDVWTVPGHIICRGTVTYTRTDRASVSLAFCNVLAMDRGRVADYRIYIDPAPLFAPSGGR